MLLWRLSGKDHAESFDGGYGLLFDGRWNTIGHAVTYCSTSPSLCVLEKLVHIEDPALMPALVMVTYEIPEQLAAESVLFEQLPADWRRHESWTQQQGDDWHNSRRTPLLKVPSAIVPIPRSPDLNVLINLLHPDARRIQIVAAQPFTLDARLF